MSDYLGSCEITTEIGIRGLGVTHEGDVNQPPRYGLIDLSYFYNSDCDILIDCAYILIVTVIFIPWGSVIHH